MFRMHFVSAHDCVEANKRLDVINKDPMTVVSGCGGEISQEWLRKHVEGCKKCKEASNEANMP